MKKDLNFNDLQQALAHYFLYLYELKKTTNDKDLPSWVLKDYKILNTYFSRGDTNGI